MRRLFPLGTALVLAAAVLTAPAGAGAAPAAPAAAAAKKVPTKFAYKASGFGTHIQGGQIPAASGQTAFQSIGCTNMAGIRRSNSQADVNIPGLGTISAVKTVNRTVRSKKQGTHATISQHDVGRIVLAQSSFGKLEIGALKSYAKASHTKGKGFSAETRTSLARLTFTPKDGKPQELDIPTLNRPIEVPGLLRVSIGFSREKKTGTWAKARANALEVKIFPTDTRVRVGHATAQIFSGVKSGVFKGYSNTTRAEVLGGVVRSGRTLLSQMPCQGTQGQVRTKAAADVNLSPLLEVGAVRSSQMGKQTNKRAHGFEEGSVASINLGDGALVVNAIKARVNVSRKAGAKKPKVNFNGTSILEAVVDGKPYALEELDGLEIPGLVKVQTNIQTRYAHGGKVIALRLTLLDGTGAVIDLGEARLTIHPRGKLK